VTIHSLEYGGTPTSAGHGNPKQTIPTWAALKMESEELIGLVEAKFQLKKAWRATTYTPVSPRSHIRGPVWDSGGG
jgi:hypothetical protein